MGPKKNSRGLIASISPLLLQLLSVGLWFETLSSLLASLYLLNQFTDVFLQLSGLAGYGDITPSTDAGKAFLTFYFLFSTIVVGSLLSDLISLYVNDFMAEKVIDQLINSTIWVHKIDVGKRGIVTEADYCVFKVGS
jgi:hypothetical protein